MRLADWAEKNRTVIQVARERLGGRLHEPSAAPKRLGRGCR
jgi:hypothetical protein